MRSAIGATPACCGSLSIRNFVVVEALDVEFADGFTVLTGETGAGKSILLDALGLLLGDRFETRQLRPGAERAELAAEFAVADAPGVGAWLAEQGIAADEGDVLLRRIFDAQGRSRAWINGSPATLAQLKELGERLVDPRTARAPGARRAGSAARAARRVRGLHRADARGRHGWRGVAAAALRDAAASAAEASANERAFLDARRRELAALGGRRRSGPSSTPRSRGSRTRRRCSKRRRRRGGAPQRGRRRAGGRARATRLAALGRGARSGDARHRRAARAGRDPDRRGRARAARLPPPPRPRSRRSSRASKPGLRRSTTPRASTACVPTRCPHSPPRPRRGLRPSRNPPTRARWRSAPLPRWRTTARWPARCLRSASSPRPSSRTA